MKKQEVLKFSTLINALRYLQSQLWTCPGIGGMQPKYEFGVNFDSGDERVRITCERKEMRDNVNDSLARFEVFEIEGCLKKGYTIHCDGKLLTDIGPLPSFDEQE